MTISAFKKVSSFDNSKSNTQIRKTWVSPLQIHETQLRAPQKSALFACLSYETDVSNDPVTICLPTGTGKTGVIGSLIFRGIDCKTLIIVPNDALRTQIADDIFDINKYKKWEVVSENAISPNVLLMTNGILSKEDINNLENVHLVVATAQSLMATDEIYLKIFFSYFKRVIFDEAHHTEANQWVNFRDYAKENLAKIYQFTATPYRLDGRKIQGKLIYRYSLHQAFLDNYFSKIEFIAVKEYYEDVSDEVIAKKALDVLEKDLKDKFEHVCNSPRLKRTPLIKS